MITNKEINEVSLSPTKKDYYQIWNEIIELATKISSRWSPDSTNESDPGIVLLKSLVAIADKLNYNIDKNTLEAFMPSATQMESMRKLTEMMGYTMKYYQAATCKVNISYRTDADISLSDIGRIYFPKFINIKNEEEDVNYVTIEDFTLQESEPIKQVAALEGELVECETNTDNIISMVHLDDSHRYILPETNIAENGIFICNIADIGGTAADSENWKPVDNLNNQLPGACVFKFGFDSAKNLPFVQFPDDISQLIKDGLRIRYIRTNGLMGNIAARTLNKLEVPALWSTAEDENIKNLTADSFSVNNPAAAVNGKNPETINDAYNNYKKTIGTFDTLVTCRDYMNKIYQMTYSDTDTAPLVSNAIVSDIRDDINKAITLCSFDEYGISYSDLSLPALDEHNNPINAIEHFDLILYPFKTIYGLNTYDEYVNSFRINTENVHRINYNLKNSKSIAHNIVTPNDDDIACIKNYLRLKANITTVKKVTTTEERDILNNIYTAIYRDFNCHRIDFGEEIPYESILNTIQNADARIKDVSLDEPLLYTTIMEKDGDEHELIATARETYYLAFLDAPTVPIFTGTKDECLKFAKKNKDTETAIAHGGFSVDKTTSGSSGGTFGLTRSDILYNKLVLRNILAGRIAAFQYDNDFKADYTELPYGTGNDQTTDTVVTYSQKYPLENYVITKMQSEFEVNASDYNTTTGLTLDDNEVIQFRIPNLKTVITYPCYVNYYVNFDLTNKDIEDFTPATFISLNSYLTENNTYTRWTTLANNSNILKKEVNVGSLRALTQLQKEYGAIFILSEETHIYTAVTDNSVYTDENIANTTFYVIDLQDDFVFPKVNTYIKKQTFTNTENDTDTHLRGIYRKIDSDDNRTPGYLIDDNHIKYVSASKPTPITNLYVQQTHDTTISGEYTINGLGKDGKHPSIGKDADYELGPNEYLLINYTDTQTDADGSETKTVVNKYWGPGTIIRPNFSLVHSPLWHNDHSYSKTSGFNFIEVSNPDGMFSLSANEQICIREIVKVELKDNNTYLYWERNDEDNEALTNEFTFTEYYNMGMKNPDYPSMSDQEYLPNAYTLKEGEHLYYTDVKKTDLAYYGAGTIIVRSEGTPRIFKSKDDAAVSADDIMSYGITAKIPWRAYKLKATTTTDTQGNSKTLERKLTIIESQYVSLTAGDTLYTISDTENKNIFGVNLDNNWYPQDDTFITSASYKFAEDPDGQITYLPTINIRGIGWKARSRLDFNLNPTVPQILHKNDSIKIESKSLLTYTVNTPVKIAPLKQNGIVTPIGIYANIPTQSACSEIINIPETYKLKLTKVDTPTINNGDPSNSISTDSLTVNLDNYINGDTTFTKFAFETVPTELRAKNWDAPTAVFSVNTNILDNKFGLIMFYYIDELSGTTNHSNAYITVDTDNTTGAGIRLFNQNGQSIAANNTTNVASSFVFTEPGIYTIEIRPGVTKINIFADHTVQAGTSTLDNGKSYQGTLIFSDLSLVKDINQKLNYRYDLNNNNVELRNGLGQLLYDIRQTGTNIANKFYYNTPIDNDNAIDLNDNIETHTLASPESWYDPNNTANKFVISEIDADYLSTGITLTKSSKV